MDEIAATLSETLYEKDLYAWTQTQATDEFFWPGRAPEDRS